MATVVKIPFTENIDHLLEKAWKESRNYDGQFTGDNNSGNFDFKALGSRFTGNYKVRGTIIEVVFTNKPFLISSVIIKAFLRQHIK